MHTLHILENSGIQPPAKNATPTLADVLGHLAQPPVAGHFDELRGTGEPPPQALDQTPAFLREPTASLAPHWAEFFNHLGSSGIGDLDRRYQELTRQVRDNGITYNVYADQNGPQRPWSVDLLPLIITPESWRVIESGVTQRAQLLESILQDIYGPQELLRQAMIPPALVHGHPGYLRPMHQVIESSGGKHLHIVAFDLARGPDDQWAVVSQRTQAPSGLGYLLENRLLVSRHFPQAFQAMGIERLAQSYQSLVHALKRNSPAGDQAHVALLTPGPYNETYFEHAYLARYLGLTLVEGNDLTVRDQKLYLRTLHGLEPVHVLLKRLDDEFLDPLELRADSTLGVPGLLQAIRAGHVQVANAPGSGFLESPGLLGFLPAISEKLLNEPLQLPAMDTWWCGEAAAMQLAFKEFDRTVIKPSFPYASLRQQFHSELASSLSESARETWRQRIRNDPDAYTLQSYIPLSQLPTWQPSKVSQAIKIVPRPYMLRVFALRDGDHRWRVLPGGLARVAGDTPGIASMQRGGSSADVWVQTGAGTGAPSQQQQPPQASLRSTRDTVGRHRLITSRAAENLYWFGRYTERSENTLRLAKLCLESLNGEQAPSNSYWQWLQLMVTSHGLAPAETLTGGHRRRLFERTIIGYLDAKEHATSVGFNLREMQRAASVVRERLSTEQWDTIRHTTEQFSSHCALATSQPEFSSVQALEALFHASKSLAAITGAQVDRMTRDDGWQMLSLGRHIERLGFLSECLSQAIQTNALAALPEDDAGFAGLLVLFDSTITFRAQHQESRNPAALFELLVTDTDNPRSLAWVASNLKSRLLKVVRASDRAQGSLATDRGEIQIQSLPFFEALEQPAELEPRRLALDPSLNQLLTQFADSAWQVSNWVTAKYFSHIGDRSIGA